MLQNKSFIIEYYRGGNMKDLPSVFANPIQKKLENVQDSYSNKEDRSVDTNPRVINKKINEIFASTSHVYKSKVKITFQDRIEEHVIVGKTNLNLLTMEGKLIKITDIVDIKKI